MEVYIWLILAVAFLVIEAACPIHLVSIWFTAGSAAAAVAAALNGPLWLQILLFVAVSGGLLLGLWPFTKKFLKPGVVKTNVDSLIGTMCHVTQDIDNIEGHGQIKVSGMEWTARSLDGTPIQAGTLVKVDHIEGVKAFVTPVCESAEKI